MVSYNKKYRQATEEEKVLILIVVEDGLVPIDYNGISDAYATS